MRSIQASRIDGHTLLLLLQSLRKLVIVCVRRPFALYTMTECVATGLYVTRVSRDGNLCMHSSPRRRISLQNSNIHLIALYCTRIVLSSSTNFDKMHSPDFIIFNKIETYNHLIGPGAGRLSAQIYMLFVPKQAAPAHTESSSLSQNRLVSNVFVQNVMRHNGTCAGCCRRCGKISFMLSSALPLPLSCSLSINISISRWSSPLDGRTAKLYRLLVYLSFDGAADAQ